MTNSGICSFTQSVIYLLLGCCLAQATVQNFVFQKTTLDNRHFTPGLIFAKTGVKSRADCARLCSANSRCVTFTFAPDGLARSGLCRAHDVMMTSESRYTSAGGAKTYQGTQWGDARSKGLTCTSKEECTFPLSECFKGQCLCSPGNYWSMRSNGCVGSCAPEDLQDTYLRYAESSITCNITYLISSEVASLKDCKAMCNGSSRKTCLSFIYWWNLRACMTFAATARQAIPQNLSTYLPDFNYFQRMCA